MARKKKRDDLPAAEVRLRVGRKVGLPNYSSLTVELEVASVSKGNDMSTVAVTEELHELLSDLVDRAVQEELEKQDKKR